MSMNMNFSLPTQSAQNLLKAGDGMKSYDASTGWGGFAEKNSQQYDASFSDNLSLKNPASFNKGQADGQLSGEERGLLQAQLHWDTSANATNKGDGTIQQGTAKNALNFLLGTAGVDANYDGKTDAADISALSKLDGNPDNITSKDLDTFYQQENAGMQDLMKQAGLDIKM